MNNFAKISAFIWVPATAFMLAFAHFSSAIPGFSAQIGFENQPVNAISEFPGSILSDDYATIIYLSKIAPESVSKTEESPKLRSVLFRADSKAIAKNGFCFAILTANIPGLAIRKLLYPFHYFW